MEDETVILTHTLSSLQDVTIWTFTAERPICVDTLPKFTVIWIKALIHILTRNTNNTVSATDFICF